MEIGEVFESGGSLWIVHKETEDDIGIPCYPFVPAVNEKWAGKKVLIIGGPLDGGEVMYSGDLLWPNKAEELDGQCYKFSESSGCYEPMFASRGSSITSLNKLMNRRPVKDRDHFKQFPDMTLQGIAFVLLGVHKVTGLKWGKEVECMQLLKFIAGHLRPEHSTPRCRITMMRLATLNWDEFRLCAEAYYGNKQSSSDG